MGEVVNLHPGVMEGPQGLVHARQHEATINLLLTIKQLLTPSLYQTNRLVNSCNSLLGGPGALTTFFQLYLGITLQYSCYDEASEI